MKKIFAAILSFFFPLLTFSAETPACPVDSVRLDGSGGSMSNVRTLDQGDLGICYACAASQAAAAKHGSTGYCPLSVAADDARVHKENITGTDNALEGSFVCRAINAANKKGYCQSCGPFYEALKRDNGGGKEFFDAANTYYNAFIQNLKTTTPTVWKNLLKNRYASDRERIAQEFRLGLCLVTPTTLRSSLVYPVQDVLIRALRANNPGEYFNAMIETTCTERNPAAGGRSPKCKDNDFPTPSKSRSILRNHFTAKTDMPIGMEFCSNMFNVARPEDFQSTYPNSSGSMMNFEAYTGAGDRMKWLLQSFQSKIEKTMDTLRAKIERNLILCAVSNCTDGTVKAKTLAYFERVQKCFTDHRVQTMRKRNRHSVYSQYLDVKKEAIGNPISTMVGKALTSCKKDLYTLSAALPTTGYPQIARNELVQKLQEQIAIAEKERTCGNHAVLLIGTRCSNNKRQYLIRNSWGQSCNGYSHDTTQSNSECEASTSTVWVNEEVVINNTYSLNKIE
ncbi:MAG: C1 family peptidase [Bdellovibrionota bacterium]